MYPSVDDPVYGTFVEVFYNNIKKANNETTDLVAIRGRYGFKILKYIVFYLQILCSLLFSKYDLIYIHTITFPMPPIWMISKIRNLPLVFNVHGADLLEGGKIVQLLRKLGRKVVLSSKLLVSPSIYFKGKIRQLYPEYPPCNIFVSPSGGVDTSVFHPIVKSRENDTKVIGFVSRIDEGKGWDIYIKAMYLLYKRNYKVKGIIVGRGSQVDSMRKLIAELEMSSVIDYIGPVPRENLPEVYSKFDLFCNASFREAESLGLVTIEAMSCGVPVVGSNMAGTAECIQCGYNGYLFNPSDTEDLSRKIVDYLNLSYEDRLQLSKNAIMSAKQFETHKIMDDMYRKLQTII